MKKYKCGSAFGKHLKFNTWLQETIPFVEYTGERLEIHGWSRPLSLILFSSIKDIYLSQIYFYIIFFILN